MTRTRPTEDAEIRPARRSLGAVVSVVVAMGLLPAGASAATLHVYQSQLTGTPTGAAGAEVPFDEPEGLAVDGSDNVYVSDVSEVGPGLIDKFSPADAFLAQGDGEGHWTGRLTRSLAFSQASDRLYVGDSQADDVWGLNPDISYAGIDLRPLGASTASHIYVAADNSGGSANGDLYVVSDSPGIVTRVDATGAAAPFSATAPYIEGDRLTGTESGAFGQNFENRNGIAVAPSGDLYVADTQTDTVDEFEPSGLFLRSITEVEGTPFSQITALAVDPSDGNLLVADSGHAVIFEFGPSGEFVGETSGEKTPSGSFGRINGLAVDSTGRLYVSDSLNGVVDVFSSVTVPDVSTGAASELSGTAATLAGSVDPDGIALTDCRFEYVTEAAFDSAGFSDLSSGGSVPCEPAFGSIPQSGETAVSAQVSGLTPGVTYRYRLLAANANGAHPGRAKTIPTVVAGESVSDITTSAAALNAQIDTLELPTTYHFEYLTEEQFKANGETFGGAAVIPTPDAAVPASPLGTGTGDLEAGRALVIRLKIASGAFPVGDTVTGAGIPWGTIVQSSSGGNNGEYALSAPATATATGVTLTVSAPVSRELTGLSPQTAYVYRVVATSSTAPGGIVGPVRVFHTHPVGVDLGLPDNRAYELVSPGVKSTGGGVIGGFEQKGFLATEDGSAIAYPGEGFFEPPNGKLPQSYTSFRGPAGWSTRNTTGENLEEAFAPLAPPVLPPTPVLPPAATAAAQVLEQTPNGSIVFFTDTGNLTPGANAAPGEPDLYRYDVATESLTDLSVDSNPGEHADVQGLLAVGGEGAEAGSYVYFVADGVLAAGASAGDCSPAAPESNEGEGGTTPGTACDLYLSHDGDTTFVGVLSARDDSPVEGLSVRTGLEPHDWAQGSGNRTAEASPSGRYLAFLALEPLTPQLAPFTGPEVFRYDAASKALLCASCETDGSASPGAFLTHRGEPDRRPHGVANDGRVFFNDQGALSPRDVNGATDVYEFEDPGTGTCQAPAGCRSLISAGTGAGNSYFATAGAEGNDVFFTSNQQLTSEDRDTSLDVYDARIDGRTPPAPEIPCETADGCHGKAAAPPVEPGATTTTFNGPEEGPNHPHSTKCKKGFVKKGAKCVNKPSKHHGHKKHHKRAGSKHGGQK